MPQPALATWRAVLRRGARVLVWAGAVALLGWLTAAGGRSGVAAGSALVVVVCAPVVWRLRVDPLDAPGLYALASAATFGIFSLLWLGVPAIPAPGIGPDEVSRALLLVSAALLVFAAGAASTGGARSLPALELEPSRLPSPRALVLVFLLGGVGLAAGLTLGALGYNSDAGAARGVIALAQLLTQLAAVGSLVIAVCAVAAFGAGSRPHARLLAFLLPLQLVGGFLVGYKSQVLAPVILTGLVYVVCRRRVPWRGAAAVLAATVLLLIPANIAYRNILRPPPGEAPRSAPSAIIADTWEYLAVRFRLIDHVALIDDRTPELFPYANGDRYVTLPALVVLPRAIWPDKPILDDGLEFSHTYWEVPPSTRTSTPLTQVGDLLRNFGTAGVLVGILLWGLIVGGLAQARARWRSARLELLFLLSLPTWVIYVEADLPQLIAGTSRTLGVAAAVFWLLLPGRSGPSGLHRLARWRGEPSGAEGLQLGFEGLRFRR